MEKIIENLNDLSENIKSLEDNLISEMSASRVDTELVLRQLAGYLNITAQNITEMAIDVKNFEVTINSFKPEVTKINDLENKIIEFPREVDKIKEATQKFYDNIAICIRKISTSYNFQSNKINDLASQISDLVKEVKDNKEEIKNSQDSLLTVINNLISNKQAVETNSVQLQETKVNSDTEKFKTKRDFWLKIILSVIGSGGMLYLIIDTVLKFVK